MRARERRLGREQSAEQGYSSERNQSVVFEAWRQARSGPPTGFGLCVDKCHRRRNSEIVFLAPFS